MNQNKDYSLNEDEKSSIQALFNTGEFLNEKINFLTAKCKNENVSREINILNQILNDVIINNCSLNKDMLDSRGNKITEWSNGEKRGGYNYSPPVGWIGFGLNVINKYDNGNNDWLSKDGNKNEWAVAYHGLRNGNAIKSIILEGFKPGPCQCHQHYNDINHPGEKVGIGSYFVPIPELMEYYSEKKLINGKAFKFGLMARVRPNKIRIPERQKDYWVLNKEEIRPYRILVKECE